MSDETTIEAVKRLRMSDKEKTIEDQAKHIEQLKARIKELEEKLEEEGYNHIEIINQFEI